MWEVACCVDVLSQVLQRKTMGKRINRLWSQSVGSECPLWTILHLTIGVNFFSNTIFNYFADADFLLQSR